MNILINSLAGGGAEIQNILLAKGNKESRIFLLEEKVDYDYGETEVINLTKSELFKSSIFRYLKTPFSAQKLAKFLKNDSTVVVSLFRSLFTAVFCKILFNNKIKVIYWIHSNPNAVPKGIFDNFYQYIYKRAYQNCEAIITNSKMGERILYRNFAIPKDKIFVVYNGFEIESIINKSDEKIEGCNLTELLEKPTVVSVGRLETVKGQRYLISVFKEVVKKIPNANLILLGEGKLRDSFEAKIKTENLEKNIHLIGFQKNPFQIIKRATVLTFTSLHEGFGNVIVEALSCGTPVISADINNGPREILAPQSDIFFRTAVPEKLDSGYLMPSFNNNQEKNIKIWSEIIIQVLNNEVTFSTEKMKARSNSFDVKNLKSHFDSIIKQVKKAT